jgi:ubiquinone/menaquinone biosynthesis C-methylase UbiE
VRKANQVEPDIPDGINLNLGCGAKLWEGFTNIDAPSNWSGKKPDIECDLKAIPLPDGHADTAYAIHVLEHFYRWETEDVLREWVRLLKVGGRLVIEVPCLDKIIKNFNDRMKHKLAINPQQTMWRLYGDPKYKDPVMVHRWCFSTEELVELMKVAGLHDVEYCNAEYHLPFCDMRVTGVK